jgi:hypothetical protein
MATKSPVAAESTPVADSSQAAATEAVDAGGAAPPVIVDADVDELDAAEPAPVAEEPAEIVDPAAYMIPMVHPDNGTCDLYETNEAGHLLVPALEAAAMIDHGFVVVDGEASQEA